MRYLLDTHIWLWWLSNDSRLSKKAKTMISDPEHQIFISAVTAWEITIKKALGKLDAPDNLIEAVEHDGFDMLPVTFHHIEKLQSLPVLHQDPFDRLLIAQAQIDHLCFMTHDQQVAKYWPNNHLNNVWLV